MIKRREGGREVERREKMADHPDEGGEWVREQCSYSWLQVKL